MTWWILATVFPHPSAVLADVPGCLQCFTKEAQGPFFTVRPGFMRHMYRFTGKLWPNQNLPWTMTRLPPSPTRSLDARRPPPTRRPALMGQMMRKSLTSVRMLLCWRARTSVWRAPWSRGEVSFQGNITGTLSLCRATYFLMCFPFMIKSPFCIYSLALLQSIYDPSAFFLTNLFHSEVKQLFYLLFLSFWNGLIMIT